MEVCGTVVVPCTVDGGSGGVLLLQALSTPGKSTMPGRAASTVRRWVQGPTLTVGIKGSGARSLMPRW